MTLAWPSFQWVNTLGPTPLRLAGTVFLAALLFTLAPRLRRETALLLSLIFFGAFTGWISLAGVLLGALLGYALWAGGESAPRPRQKALLIAVLLLNAGLYFGVMNASRLGRSTPLPSVQALGLSYLFWRVIHLAVDAYRGRLIRPPLLHYLLYLFYFPAMKGGPIQRLPEFSAAPFFTGAAWRPQLTLPILFRLGGGFCKLLVCHFWLNLDYAALWNQTATLPYLDLVKILYVRAISFYLIASGANDLTLMFSLLLRIPLPENYHYPYFQRNLAHFWRNWHMTLTACLRDYIYEPLGGKRKHQYRNYLLTFLVCAFWHTVSPAFLIWGLMHGLGLCCLRLWQDFWNLRLPAWGPWGAFLLGLRDRLRRHPAFSRTLSGLLTFHFVALSWLPFWGGHPQGTTALLRLLGLGALFH